MAEPAKRPRRPQARKYVSAASADLLARCFPGMVPARVIEEALREKAKREKRILPPTPPRRNT